MVEVTVDAREFGSVLKAAQAYDKKIYKSLRRNLIAAGDETVSDIRAELAKPPPGSGRFQSRRAHSGRSKGIRGTLSKNTKATIRNSPDAVGVEITTGTTGLGRHSAMAVLYNRKSFRHPVYGQRSTQVTQSGRPYFGAVIYRNRDRMEAAVQRALGDAVDAMSKEPTRG